MTTFDVRLLGPLEVVVDGAPVAVGSAKQRAVLTLLALRAPATVTTDVLVEALWGERPPRSATHGLHVHVSGLRRALQAAGAALETRPGGYGLAVTVGALETSRFEALVELGRRVVVDDPRAATEALARALALWRGDACAELSGEPWAAPEAARLEELRLEALELRVEADLALGRHAALTGELRALVTSHPYRERLWHHLILALHRSGRSSAALEAARELRAALDELGVLPAPQLAELEHGVLLHDPALAPGDLPVRRVTTLPTPPTALLGREAETLRLDALLNDESVRLITVRGPGGVGKSRLALEVARSVSAERFPGGVVFVRLDALRDPGLVIATVAQGFGGAGPQDASEVARIAREVGGARTLLVLDNLEHLLAAVAQVGELLSAAPPLTVLATSRTSLRLGAEHDFPLDPLALPDDDAADRADAELGPAVALFVARARAVRQDFALTAETIPPVSDICRRLDGLPLAIELAAARSRVLDPAELCHRLDRRLGTLTTGARDLPARQRTLRATIEWSVRLLTPASHVMLDRLSVFVGGFDVAAAEDVCAADLDDPLTALEELLDNSLIGRDATAGRLRMLETIREHAAESLAARDEHAATQDRLAAWALERGEEARIAQRSSRRSGGTAGLTLDLDNLRAALGWLEQSHRWDDLARLASALESTWHTGGHIIEGLTWLERCLAQSTLDDVVRAGAGASAARLAMERGELARAREHGSTAARLARRIGAADALATALMAQAGSAFYRGDHALMRTLLAEARPVLGELGDEWQLIFLEFALGSAAMAEGDYPEATHRLTKAVDGYTRIGDEWGLAAAEMNLGEVLVAEGRNVEALALAEQALQRYERLGDRSWIVNALTMLSEALAPLDAGRAERLGRRAAELALSTGQHIWLPAALMALARLDLQGGRYEAAARLVGAAAAAGHRLGVVETLHEAHRAQALRTELAGHLGPDQARRLVEEGERSGPEALVALRVRPAQLASPAVPPP